MPVNVRIKDPGAARTILSRQVGGIMRKRMEAAGKQMVKDANSLMGGLYNLDRPYERRRWPGSRRASGALAYDIEGGVDLPMTLQWRVLGGQETFNKIVGLNYGIHGHIIHGGSGTWPLKGQMQVNRMGGSKRRGGDNRRPDLLAWVDENGDVMVPEVDHPGNAAGGFLEEAFELAVFRLKTG